MTDDITEEPENPMENDGGTVDMSFAATRIDPKDLPPEKEKRTHKTFAERVNPAPLGGARTRERKNATFAGRMNPDPLGGARKREVFEKANREQAIKALGEGKKQVAGQLPVPVPANAPAPLELGPVIAELSKRFVTSEMVEELASEAVPECIRHLGESMPTGNTLKLGPFGFATWGPPDSGNPFSGRVWVGNFPKLTIDQNEAGATRYLGIYLDGSGYYWASSMPDSQPADAVVYDLNYVSGDIHIPGSIAGP